MTTDGQPPIERLIIIGAGASAPAGLPTIDSFTAFILARANQSLAEKVAIFLASEPHIQNIEDLFSELAEGRRTGALLRQLSDAVARSFHDHYRHFLAEHYSARVPGLGYEHEAPDFPAWPEWQKLDGLQHAIGFRSARNLSDAVFSLTSDGRRSQLQAEKDKDSACLGVAEEIARFLSRVCRRFNYYDILVSSLRPTDVVIDLNYDCLFEVAMQMACAKPGYRYVGIEPVGFRTCSHGHTWCNVGAAGSWLSMPHAVRVLKPHGSVNWLECAQCSTPYAVPIQMTKGAFVKEVRRLSAGLLSCGHSVGKVQRLLIPPFKAKVWEPGSHIDRAIEYSQRNFDKVKEVAALGFSFSGADEHVRKILEIVPGEAGVTIVNPDGSNEFRQQCRSFWGGRHRLKFETEPTEWLVAEFLRVLRDKQEAPR